MNIFLLYKCIYDIITTVNKMMVQNRERYNYSLCINRIYYVNYPLTGIQAHGHTYMHIYMIVHCMPVMM